uniref:Uncharacterized protein n=1 Tax=Arundo donax TaxID=35708 RepID=A0A0A9ND79_ARUDO
MAGITGPAAAGGAAVASSLPSRPLPQPPPPPFQKLLDRLHPGGI